jgi:hypothetical protein
MPRYTETVDIEGALDTVENALDDVADEVVALEAEIDDHDDPPAPLLDEYQSALERGQRLERHRDGLAWALDPDSEVDAITEVTIGALTAGEVATVTDRTASMETKKTDDWGVQATLDAANRTEFAAAGLVDAPFIDDSADHADVVGALAECAPQFVAWLADRVDELSTPNIEGNGFAERVNSKRTTRSDTSGTPEQS